jgi:hypothetical protein
VGLDSLLSERIFERNLPVAERENITPFDFNCTLRGVRGHCPFGQAAITGDKVFGSVELNIGHPGKYFLNRLADAVCAFEARTTYIWPRAKLHDAVGRHRRQNHCGIVTIPSLRIVVQKFDSDGGHAYLSLSRLLTVFRAVKPVFIA